MLALTTLLLAAAPVHAVGLDVPNPAVALEALSLPGGRALDLSAPYRYLLRPAGLLPLQDFEGFSAAPLASWPPALAPQWNHGVAHCRDTVGRPPWKGAALASAAACGQRLSQYLWQRLAAHHGAARVFELTASPDPTRKRTLLHGLAWAPATGEQLELRAVVPDAEGPAGLDAAVKRLAEQLLRDELAGAGERKPRTVVSTMGEAGSADPFTAAEAVTTPLKVSRSCAATSVTLAFKSPGVVARSLVARWPAPPGGAPALDCGLAFAEHTEDLGPPLGPSLVVTATLTCGPHRVVAETSKTNPVRKPVAVLTEGLAQGLAAKLCP